MVGRPPFCAWCPLTNRRKTGCEAELFLKKSPHKSVQKSAKSCRCFMLFFCFPAGDSRVWGRHSPTRFPQGQNERKANFGTAVESCSKKLPDCCSLPTATFSENRNQLFYKRLPDCPHLLLPLFWEIYNQFFIKGGGLAFSPLLPTNHKRAEWTDFPARTFPAARSFPTIRRFGSCVLPAVWKNGSLFWLHCLIRNFWKFAKNGCKKSSKSFSDLLLRVPLRGGWIFSFYAIG